MGGSASLRELAVKIFPLLNRLSTARSTSAHHRQHLSSISDRSFKLPNLGTVRQTHVRLGVIGTLSSRLGACCERGLYERNIGNHYT